MLEQMASDFAVFRMFGQQIKPGGFDLTWVVNDFEVSISAELDFMIEGKNAELTGKDFAHKKCVTPWQGQPLLPFSPSLPLSLPLCVFYLLSLSLSPRFCPFQRPEECKKSRGNDGKIGRERERNRQIDSLTHFCLFVCLRLLLCLAGMRRCPRFTGI